MFSSDISCQNRLRILGRQRSQGSSISLIAWKIYEYIIWEKFVVSLKSDMRWDRTAEGSYVVHLSFSLRCSRVRQFHCRSYICPSSCGNIVWKMNSEIGVREIVISRHGLIAQSGSLKSNTGCGRLIATDLEPSVLCSLTLKYEWKVIHSCIGRRW